MISAATFGEPVGPRDARAALHEVSADPLVRTDPEVERLLIAEEERQRDGLELIPSENYASPAVRAALSSVLTNKYSEGYSGQRYYGGQEVIDAVEDLACARALRLFLRGKECLEWDANVQPYSGTSANIAVLLGLAPLGSRLLGLQLTHGGHLSHGHRVAFSGIAYEAHQYALDPTTEHLDFDAIRALARRVRPAILFSGASAYPRAIDFRALQSIADEVGALHVADIAHVAGLIVGGAHPSPFPFTPVVTFTTHKTLRGPRGGVIVSRREHSAAIARAVFPGIQGGPHDHVTAAKAVCFQEALQPEFSVYARQVVANARSLAERLAEHGFRLVTGGTDTHLLLLDLRPHGLTGTEAEAALDLVGITANKNTIPDDPRPPKDPSGLRLGTPPLTTRGMREDAMRRIADWIAETLLHRSDTDRLTRLREEVRAFARAFPPP
ncbi:MAG: glycine hydroxymethyltransferase [Parcubacteria group bacterium Gr01-1014_38]|nr:MAG: glycine hydroxymethyltransferase [Parcubacteria group bacterium Gr01-1014_38]